MDEMFCNCKLLKSLDLKNFNTSKVIYLTYMFENCSALTELDLSNFNTSKAEDMSSMFENCKSLKTLNIQNFKLHDTYIDDMFKNFSPNATVIVNEYAYETICQDKYSGKKYVKHWKVFCDEDE